MPGLLKVLLIATGSFIAIAVAGAFALAAVFFPPSERRDRDREIALHAIAQTLHERYGKERSPSLPLAIAAPAGIGYRNLGNGEYQLCTTFENERPGGTGTWAHRLGRNCFQFSVHDRPWMDPSKRRWIFQTC